jgi:hypothetical protein
MKPAAASSGQEMTTMMKIAKKAGFGRVVGLVLCFAGAGAGLWLYASGGFVRARQDAGTITVTGRESPFACSVEKSLTKEQRERKKQIAQKMASARVETKELENGYVFRFRPEAISFAEVADWVGSERVCCPFFDLAIEAERENGPLSLSITGREGVKAFIQGEFHVLGLG